MMVGNGWRRRLREAIDRTDRKHSDIAWGAGIACVTLSRVLSGVSKEPSFSVVVRIAHETGITVGWLLEERGFHIGAAERARLRNAARAILDLTGED